MPGPKVLDKLERLPLNQAVRHAMRLAKAASNTELTRWCRLELQGYWESNPAMTEETLVPEYRTVSGQHFDIYGRPLILAKNLSFVGTTRIRSGIDEIEGLIKTHKMVSIHDPGMCDLIREELGVEVYSFKFSSSNLTGMLSVIRLELLECAGSLESPQPAGKELVGSSAASPAGGDEIFELRPNFYGIGINLKALWRAVGKG